jgi:hypothetical protein
MSESPCKTCKVLFDRAVTAMSSNAHAIARFSQAVATNPEADFKALETEVNDTRINRERAREEYEFHLATHEKVRAFGSGGGIVERRETVSQANRGTSASDV